MKRIKKYKSLPPGETITNISNILCEKLGITLNVTEYAEKNNLFFSSRVNVETDTFKGFKIGTNGKGLTREFSLASAHAEFMERLQNGLLFHHRYYTTHRFADTYHNKEDEDTCPLFCKCFRINVY